MFANCAGLEMLETTSGALQDLPWEETLDENGRKTAFADFTQVLQQVSQIISNVDSMLKFSS